MEILGKTTMEKKTNYYVEKRGVLYGNFEMGVVGFILGKQGFEVEEPTIFSFQLVGPLSRQDLTCLPDHTQLYGMSWTASRGPIFESP